MFGSVLSPTLPPMKRDLLELSNAHCDHVLIDCRGQGTILVTKTSAKVGLLFKNVSKVHGMRHKHDLLSDGSFMSSFTVSRQQWGGSVKRQ